MKQNSELTKKRGVFISVEGIDGAGKSSHITLIKDYLEQHGMEVVTAREPGGTDVGEKIRDLLLHDSLHMDATCELFLLFASRQELITNVLEPNLALGKAIILDRYVDSSIAYQGAGRKMGVARVKKVFSLLRPRLLPDLTFLFDVDIKIAMARLAKNNKKDRIEQEGAKFFAKVQKAYYKIAKDEPLRVKIIQTGREKEETRAEIRSYLQLLMSNYGK